MAKFSDATAFRAPPADPLEAINWLTDETAADRRKESYWLVVMLRARNEIERLRSVATAEMKLREGNFAEIERLRAEVSEWSADYSEAWALLNRSIARETELHEETLQLRARVAELKADADRWYRRAVALGHPTWDDADRAAAMKESSR